MTLLTIVQGVARRVNYPQPTLAFASSDPNILLMVDCVQDTGDELCERWGWQELKLAVAATFTGDGTTAAFPLPSSLETLQPDAIMVSSAYPQMRMPGPINEDSFLLQKLTPASSVPSPWRIVGNKVEFFPVLASGEIVSYIFQGKFWINNGSTASAAFVADADTVSISERLLRLGARWRFRQAKGLAYDEEMRDYELAFDRIAGQQSTGRNVAMSKRDTLSDSDPSEQFFGSVTGKIGDFASGTDFNINDFSQ